MLVDYHLHIERGPYNLDWLDKFIRQGTSMGVAEFGFSEHCYRFKQARHLLDNSWASPRCTVDIEAYIHLLEQAKAKGWPVKLGLEVDYIPEKEQEIREFLKQYPLDYAIGSVHWLGDWGFDLAETLPAWESANINEVYRRYFQLVQQAAKSNLFDFLGHLDLVKIFGYRPTENMTALYEQTVQVISQAGCAVEVSTAGLRKKVAEIYPLPQLLRLCKQHSVPITLSSDAHEPEQVGENFDLALKLLRECDYTSLLGFDKRTPIRISLKESL